MESPGRQPTRLLLGLLLGLYALMLAAYFVPVVTGTDDNGYHLAARMLERHGRFYQTPTDDLAFVGRMWVVAEDGNYYPKYPPLYPLAAATAMRAFGDLGGLLLSPIFAWSTVLATFLICRARKLPRDVSLLGAFVVATAPLANSFAVVQVSHATSLALLTWGFLLLVLALDPVRERARPWLLVGSGLLLGYAAGVRYTNALLVLPGLVWLWTEARHQPQRLATWLGAWLVPCGLVAGYHWRSFGSPLSTAYSLTEEQAGFAVSYALENLRLYASTAPVVLAGPVTLLALIGWLLVWRRDTRRALVYVAWTVPLILVYLAYYWAPEGHPRSYVRFLLPLLLPIVLLAMRAIDQIAERLDLGRRGRTAVLAAVLVLQGAWGLFATLEQLELLLGDNARIKASVDLVRSHAEPGSVVIGELESLDSLDYFQEYDLYWANLLDQEILSQRLDRTLATGPDSLQLERAERLEERLVDTSPQEHRQRLLAVIEPPLAQGRDVWVVGDGATYGKMERFADGEFLLEQVAELPVSGRVHRLFEPGRTVSRAAGGGGLPTRPFFVWRLVRAP